MVDIYRLRPRSIRINYTSSHTTWVLSPPQGQNAGRLNAARKFPLYLNVGDDSTKGSSEYTGGLDIYGPAEVWVDFEIRTAAVVTHVVTHDLGSAIALHPQGQWDRKWTYVEPEYWQPLHMRTMKRNTS